MSDAKKNHVALRLPIDKKFKKLWKYYIWQSILAAVAFFVILLILGKEKIVVISAMGATAFIVFAMPNAVSAKSKNVIGGHLVGLILGMIFYFVEIPYLFEFRARQPLPSEFHVNQPLSGRLHSIEPPPG